MYLCRVNQTNLCMKGQQPTGPSTQCGPHCWLNEIAKNTFFSLQRKSVEFIGEDVADQSGWRWWAGDKMRKPRTNWRATKNCCTPSFLPKLRTNLLPITSNIWMLYLANRFFCLSSQISGKKIVLPITWNIRIICLANRACRPLPQISSKVEFLFATF